jgi:DNA-binding response OmpR family regulator
MAKILLIGADREHRENLARRLRAHGHSVEIVNDWASSEVKRRTLISPAEILIIDVTLLTENNGPDLRRTCHAARMDGYPTLVLCYSRTERGPRFELAIERLGARYVYSD